MNANELRIGNYVDLFGSIAQIQRADFDTTDVGCAVDRGKPIPLTEEWLLKSGVETTRYEKSFRGVYYSFMIDGILYYYFTDMDTIEKQGSHMIYKYVHSFQNLYFALTQKELTIKE